MRNDESDNDIVVAELDLSDERPTTLPPLVEMRDVAIERERTQRLDDLVRSLIAILLALLFGLTIVLAFLRTGDDETWDNTKELLDVLLPAETGILGAAIGYYFGSRDRTRRGE